MIGTFHSEAGLKALASRGDLDSLNPRPHQSSRSASAGGQVLERVISRRSLSACLHAGGVNGSPQ